MLSIHAGGLQFFPAAAVNEMHLGLGECLTNLFGDLAGGPSPPKDPGESINQQALVTGEHRKEMIPVSLGFDIVQNEMNFGRQKTKAHGRRDAGGNFPALPQRLRAVENHQRTHGITDHLFQNRRAALPLQRGTPLVQGNHAGRGLGGAGTPEGSLVRDAGNRCFPELPFENAHMKKRQIGQPRCPGPIRPHAPVFGTTRQMPAADFFHAVQKSGIVARRKRRTGEQVGHGSVSFSRRSNQSGLTKTELVLEQGSRKIMFHSRRRTGSVARNDSDSKSACSVSQISFSGN